MREPDSSEATLSCYLQPGEMAADRCSRANMRADGALFMMGVRRTATLRSFKSGLVITGLNRVFLNNDAKL